MAQMPDEAYMKEAMALAATARGRTAPNPMVGAVVVADGEVVGRGYHARAGTPHAEVLALAEAGSAARGATLYTTLEPCAHWGRTPPCADTIIERGICRVVSALEDPDPQVSGRGHARLREAGIAVEIGLMEEPARRLNEAYIKHRTAGLPLVALKWAMSLDGKIAGRRGEETAITGPSARSVAHELRNQYDAVLVGIGTVLADDPRLTCRLPGGRNPLRVVLDSTLRIPLDAEVVRGARDTPTLVATTARASAERARVLLACGVEVLTVGSERVELRALLEVLAGRGLLSVLVEGGAAVHAAFLEAGFADRVYAFVAPMLLGGPDTPAPVEGADLLGRGAPLRLREVSMRQAGEDVLIEGKL